MLYKTKVKRARDVRLIYLIHKSHIPYAFETFKYLKFKFFLISQNHFEEKYEIQIPFTFIFWLNPWWQMRIAFLLGLNKFVQLLKLTCFCLIFFLLTSVKNPVMGFKSRFITWKDVWLSMSIQLYLKPCWSASFCPLVQPKFKKTWSMLL